MPEDEYALAILHLDYQERVQLLARDILLDDLELSAYPSAVLQSTSISAKVLPFPTEAVPQLAPVPMGVLEDGDDGEESFLGGVLILGGRKILLYELASSEGQAKQRGKRRRLESKKRSGDAADAAKAREKEREREARIRKAQGSIDWPWGEVIACVYASLFIVRIRFIFFTNTVTALLTKTPQDTSLVTRLEGCPCYP